MTVRDFQIFTCRKSEQPGSIVGFNFPRFEITPCAQLTQCKIYNSDLLSGLNKAQHCTAAIQFGIIRMRAEKNRV